MNKVRIDTLTHVLIQIENYFTKVVSQKIIQIFLVLFEEPEMVNEKLISDYKSIILFTEHVTQISIY